MLAVCAFFGEIKQGDDILLLIELISEAFILMINTLFWQIVESTTFDMKMLQICKEVSSLL